MIRVHDVGFPRINEDTVLKKRKRKKRQLREREREAMGTMVVAEC